MDAKTKYGLVVLAEELGELQKEVFKAIRFGLYDVNPKTGQTNVDAMRDEFCDVVGAMEFLDKEDAMVNLVDIIDYQAVQNKVVKIEHYYKYSQERGWD